MRKYGGKNVHLVTLCLAIALMVVFGIREWQEKEDTKAATISSANTATYSPNSPHWPHINILDFGTNVRGLQSGAIRQAAYEWYARHVDSMFINMDTFTHYYDANMKATAIKSLNPSIKVFGEDLDQFMCQTIACNGEHGPNTAVENLPEDYYLHFSTDTHVDFYGFDGVTFKGHVDIPGCPATEPVTKACRIQLWEYSNNKAWISNMKSENWRNWFAGHLIDEMTINGGQPNPTDTILLDGHGPGFSGMMSIPYLNKIISGGNIREYNDRVPTPTGWVYHPDRKEWGNSYDDLDREYNTDVSNWLVYLRTRLAAVGKSVRINVGDGIHDPLTVEQSLAAGSIVTEHLNKATSHVTGVNRYPKIINQIRRMTAAGGTVDLMGTLYYATPENITRDAPLFNGGNYATPFDRFRMWSLANYYMAKESTSDVGKVYFDPAMYLDGNLADPVAGLEQQWIAAYEVDVGQPVGEYSIVQQGPIGCTSDGYGVFTREYTNARILLRPRDSWNCTEYGDAGAVTVVLDEPMQMLMPDRVLMPPVESVRLRSGEAVIMFKVQPVEDTIPAVGGMTPTEETTPNLTTISNLHIKGGMPVVKIGDKYHSFKPFGTKYRGGLWAKKVEFKAPNSTWYLVANTGRQAKGVVAVYSVKGKRVLTLKAGEKFATKGWRIDMIAQPSGRVLLAMVPKNGGRTIRLYEVTRSGVRSRRFVTVGKKGKDVLLRFVKRNSTEYGLAAMVLKQPKTKIMYRYAESINKFLQDEIFDTQRIKVKNNRILLE